MPQLVPWIPRAGAASATMRSATPVSRDGSQTLDRELWPVIMVPGIMGSRIEMASGTDRIWDPDRTRFMLWLMTQSPDTLTRHYNYRLNPGRTMGSIYDDDNNAYESQDAAERAFGLTRNQRNWGSVSWEYYGPGTLAMQRAIAAQGGVMWCFGYDWREPNQDTGLALKNFIKNTVRPTSPYKPIIITHSMGGLVTRAGCAIHEMESLVSAVIHTMMPTHGAAECYASIKSGGMAGAFAYLIGDTPQEVQCTSSGVAGMYQLMCNNLYPDPTWLSLDSRLGPAGTPSSTTHHTADMYTIYREANAMVGLVKHSEFATGVVNVGSSRYVNTTRRVLSHILENIDMAENYHTNQVRNYCHPQTWLIAGTGKNTVTDVNVAYTQPTYHGTPLNPVAVTTHTATTLGDATVPLVSARALESHANCQGGFVTSGNNEHSGSVNDPVVIPAMVNLIQTARTQTATRW